MLNKIAVKINMNGWFVRISNKNGHGIISGIIPGSANLKGEYMKVLVKGKWCKASKEFENTVKDIDRQQMDAEIKARNEQEARENTQSQKLIPFFMVLLGCLIAVILTRFC